MKRYFFGLIMVAVAAGFLSGCIGSGGSSASAPTDVQAFARDSRVIVTWTMEPGVEYWIYHAAGSGVTPENCASMYLCDTDVKVSSPASITGLLNGTSYSFSINGRKDGGPGGAGSTAVAAMPRLAGSTWTEGTSTGVNLRGVAYGTYDSRYVAAGNNGALYTGAVSTSAAGVTGITWSTVTNPSTATFNAVNYDSTRAKYIGVGAGGAIIAMTPSSSTTWSLQTSGITRDLFAVANSGGSYTTVAVGTGGTIIYSSDGGTTWADKTSVSGTTNALYGVAYGYSTTLAQYVFVAVGASSTLRYSKDYGLTWLSAACATCSGTPDLKGVTYGGLDASGHSVFVAVGASGTVLTSPDGVAWTPQTSGTTATLNAVAYSAGHRFIAVAENGSIYYSEYYSSGTTGNGAATWAAATSPVATPLYAIATGVLFDFSAVGSGGVNLYAD